MGKLPELQLNPLKKIYNRTRILRQANKFGVSLELLNEAVCYDDPVLEKTLLNYDSIPKECLQILSEKGNSKAVRNRACSILKKQQIQIGDLISQKISCWCLMKILLSIDPRKRRINI